MLSQLQFSHVDLRDINLIKMLKVRSTYLASSSRLSINVIVSPLSVIITHCIALLFWFWLLQITLYHSPISFALQIYHSFSCLKPSLFWAGMYINSTGELDRTEVRSSSSNPLILQTHRERETVCVAWWSVVCKCIFQLSTHSTKIH